MKHLIIMAALAVSSTAWAASLNMERVPLGAGQPGSTGFENANVVGNADVGNNIHHAPQYLPYFPTAATIWPRVVDVPCEQVGTSLQCAGYNWLPQYGRAEYLFIRPVVEAPRSPVTIEKIVPVPVTVIKEVPVKKGKQ